MKRLLITLAALALVACSPKPERPKVEKTSYVCKVTVHEHITSGYNGNVDQNTKKTYERYYSFHVTFSPFLGLDPMLPADKQPQPGLLVKGEKYRQINPLQLTHSVVFDDRPFGVVNIDDDDYKTKTIIRVTNETVSVNHHHTDTYGGKRGANMSLQISYDPITKVFSHSEHFDQIHKNGGYMKTINSNGLCEPITK